MCPEPAPTVAIDGRAVIRAEIGGVERYAIEVARVLRALRPERYRLITPRPRLAHRAGHVWEQAVLPLAARDCRLVLCPANLAPMLGPPVGPARVVVVHDVAALSRPDAYSPGYVAYQRRVLPVIARGAARVITVSAFSRAEIVETLGVAPERIALAPGGVSPRFNPGADTTAAREALGLAADAEYVLAVGTASARKNLSVLTRAAAALAEGGIELVLAGSSREYLRGVAPDGVRRLGYVPDGHLPGLYAGARALVMPSLHEGFGLPCLEAMASGTPVVAARAGALPETCGDAALLVDPADAHGFADALRVLTGDEAGERDRLVATGRRRAARFTWERTAEAIDGVVSDVLASG